MTQDLEMALHNLLSALKEYNRSLVEANEGGNRLVNELTAQLENEGLLLTCGEGGGKFERGADARVDAGMKCGFCSYVSGGCEEGKVYSRDYMDRMEAYAETMAKND